MKRIQILVDLLHAEERWKRVSGFVLKIWVEWILVAVAVFVPISIWGVLRPPAKAAAVLPPALDFLLDFSPKVVFVAGLTATTTIFVASRCFTTNGFD